jgi:hypothetical protein
LVLRDLDAPLVLRDVETWVADPAAPLPSGADAGHIVPELAKR